MIIKDLDYCLYKSLILSHREILIVTTMEKGHWRSRSVEIKHKLFEFYLTGVWGDYNACIKNIE